MLQYLRLAVVALVGITIGFVAGHIHGSNATSAAIQSKLANDRVTILKDGKQIDEKAFTADDSVLCAMLGGC